MNGNKAIRLLAGLFIAPFIIPIPIAGFILWDSLGHWRTTALSIFEYYYFPLVFLGYYLAIVVPTEILLVGLLALLSRWRVKKEMKECPKRVAGLTDEGRLSWEPISTMEARGFEIRK